MDRNMLFNKKSSDFKDNVKKEAYKREIALKVNQDPEDMKHWFATQRTHFVMLGKANPKLTDRETLLMSCGPYHPPICKFNK